MEHTKEPWKVNGDEVGYISDNDDQSFGMFCPVGVIYEPANARRIVACVNACAGIPSERLEQMPPINATKEWVDTVLQWKDQRDELQKDAERYRWIRNNPTWIGYDADYRPDEVDAAIDVAIAKVQK